MIRVRQTVVGARVTGLEGHVILRILRGRVQSSRLRALAATARDAYAPVASAIGGLARFHVATRPIGRAHELAIVTFWKDVDAALKVYGGDLARPVVLGGVRFDATFTGVDYYEVDEVQIRDADATPGVLRISAGEIERGLDAEIQRDIRDRLPALNGELLEAYVARRLVDSVVEVAFVSTWRREPPDTALSEPVWPDISTRYSKFLLETYVPLDLGTAVPEARQERSADG